MISVTSKNIDIEQETRDYINEKFSDLDKYLDRIQFIDVFLEKNKLRNQVNLKIGVKKMGAVTLKGEAENLREAIDLIRDKAKTRLTRLKEKAISQ
ncbi:ribosome hibernation-promoting factor, HPF/YfiA family [Fibrobacterota bacterium]